MPELKNRSEDEERMLAILMMLFASEDMGFWLAEFKSPQFFADQLQGLKLDANLLDVSGRARERMLKELRIQIDATDVDRRMRQLTEHYRYDLAARLAKRHADWLREHQTEVSDWERRTASGERLPKPPAPKPSTIYNEAQGAREAASAITDWVSSTELEIADEIARVYGKKLEGTWITEADPCPICAELAFTTREFWGRKFPRGPKAHPNCVLPETLVRFPFGITASMKAEYSGKVCDICVGDGIIFSLTSGHPVPTPSGPKAAGSLRQGDLVFVDPYSEHVDTTADRQHRQMARSASREVELVSPEVSSLHGEGIRIRSAIEIAGNPIPAMQIGVMAPDIQSVFRDFRVRQQTVAVVFSSHRDYAGPVYDFSAMRAPFFVANGVYVSNCRCWIDWQEVLED